MKAVPKIIRTVLCLSILLFGTAQLIFVNDIIEKTSEPKIMTSLSPIINQSTPSVNHIVQTLAIRNTHQDRVRFDQNLFQQGYLPRFPTEKRGVVMCLHEGIAALGISFVQELRRWNNSLPIQVYHCLQSELPPSIRTLVLLSDPLERIEIIDVCAHLINNRYLTDNFVAKEYQSYYIKLLAVLHTSFDEVMLVDADDIFLHNPDILWANSGFIDTGTLFFYDRHLDLNQFINAGLQNSPKVLHQLHENFPYAMFGLKKPQVSEQLSNSRAWQGRTAHEQDSSLVILHKSKLKPMVFEIMWHLVHFARVEANLKSKSLGDKEYFWLSCMLADVPYSFSPHPAAVIEQPGDLIKHNKTLCGSLAQYAPINTTNVPLLYMNARAVITPEQVKNRTQHNWEAAEKYLIKRMPHYVTPLQQTRQFEANRQGLDHTCLINQGATPIQEPNYQEHIRQRIHDTVGHEPQFPLAKRGIVMCLHNNIAPMGLSFLQELRDMGNELHVQIYHCLPQEMSVATKQNILKADRLNRTEIIDICSLLLANGHLQDIEEAETYQSYFIKPNAFLQSAFDEVLLVDADAIFLQNPDILWTMPGYIATGTQFFLDRLIEFNDYFSTPISGNARLLHRLFFEFPYKQFGLNQPLLTKAFQKSDAWQGLNPLYKIYFGIWFITCDFSPNTNQCLQILGDKEYFWLSFWLSGTPHSFSPHAAAVVADPEDMQLHPETLCGSLAHYLPVNASDAPLLYINGRAILTPPQDEGILSIIWKQSFEEKEALLRAQIPKHVTPQRFKRHYDPNRGDYSMTCLIGQGAIPIPIPHFETQIVRRIHRTIVATQRLLENKEEPNVTVVSASIGTAAPFDENIYDASIFRQGYTPAFPDATRGIVLSLHDNVAALGISLIQELRAWNNTLPIQVYSCLDEELSGDTEAMILNADPLKKTEFIEVCSLLIATGYLMDEEQALGYQSYYLKNIAVLHSSFDEIMLLDADDIFLANPDVLWDIPSYQKTGTLFFYDRQIDFEQFFNTLLGWDVTMINDLHRTFPYSLFGLKEPGITDQQSNSRAWQHKTAHEQDSSVVILNKKKIGNVMLQVMWYLIHYMRFEHRYEFGLSWGDKEYFWMSCFLSNTSYTFSPHPAAVVSLPDDIKLHPNTLCGSLAHYLPIESPNPPLLYINGKDVINPYFNSSTTYWQNDTWATKEAYLVSVIPEYVTPVQKERQFSVERMGLDQSCLIDQGAARINISNFHDHVARRIHNTILAASIITTKTPPKEPTIPPELVPLFENPPRTIRLDRARYDETIFKQGFTSKFASETQGIVFSLFDDMTGVGYSLIQELRSLGNIKPIQIYHCFEELTEKNQALILEADVLNRTETIEICSLLLDNRYLSNLLDALEYQSYYIKILALLHTSFDEVMMLDVDDIFFQNPDVLWTIPSYQATGTLFFYDRQIDFKQFFDSPFSSDNRTMLLHLYEEFPYEAFFLKRPELSAKVLASKAWQAVTSHEQDSSVVLFHKSKVGLPTLQFIILEGDKEYFWLSCFLSNVEYSFSPYVASVVSLPDDISRHPNTLCGSLVHYLPRESNNPQLLYINGRDIILPCSDCPDIFPFDTKWEVKAEYLSERIPQFVTPRQKLRQFESNRDGYDQTCLINQGATPIELKGYEEHLKTRINNTCAADSRVEKLPVLLGLFFRGPVNH
ncbi:hypothetical protein THRCLA_09752 [Thraustotheca clavata]|uniref:Uncharacterized protein n=1 Tax=Thraustotheca clavata TaxID=74557 RepID=A0A1V9YUK3_9STRA|nr:hypothetical protein THRCLA_09752 [Thraustotheca clavata]